MLLFRRHNILINAKSYENILVYNILYKNSISAKPLLIRFDKIYGFIRVYDKSRYLLLLGSGKYYYVYNRYLEV